MQQRVCLRSERRRKIGGVLVCPTGFEPATYRVGVCHSIQLSYGHIYDVLILSAAIIITKYLYKVNSLFSFLKVYAIINLSITNWG